MKISICSFIQLLLLYFLLSACSKSSSFVSSMQYTETAEFNAKLGVFPNTDSYVIQDVSIDANFLFITVQYEASCSGNDVIELIGSEQLINATVPIRQVKLVIHANEEECREFRSRTIIFGIKELSGMKVRDFETDLNIFGYRTKMRYVYV